MDDGIRVEYLDDEIRIDLPVRESDELHRFGRIIVAAGFSVIALCLIFAPPATVVGAAIAIGINPANIAVYLGVCFVTDKTNCCLRWNNNSLETVEYFEWLKWTRSCHSGGIRHFVYSSIMNHYTDGLERFMPQGLQNLNLELEHYDAPHSLIYWYPRFILEKITCEIIAELELRANSHSSVDAMDDVGADEPIASTPVTNQQAHKIEVLEQSDHDCIIKKPAGSLVKLKIRSSHRVQGTAKSFCRR